MVSFKIKSGTYGVMSTMCDCTTFPGMELACLCLVKIHKLQKYINA